MTLEFQGCTKPTPGQSTNGPGPWETNIFTSHRIHIWYIHLHEKVDFYGKCIGKYIIHGWFENIRNQHFDHPILGIQCTFQGGTKKTYPLRQPALLKIVPCRGNTCQRKKRHLLIRKKSHIEWSGSLRSQFPQNLFQFLFAIRQMLRSTEDVHACPRLFLLGYLENLDGWKLLPIYIGSGWNCWRCYRNIMKFHLPFCYMYDTFTCMWRKFMVNVGQYPIHGASGFAKPWNKSKVFIKFHPFFQWSGLECREELFQANTMQSTLQIEINSIIHLAIIIFHQPRFPWNVSGISLPTNLLPFGGVLLAWGRERIWPDPSSNPQFFDWAFWCFQRHEFQHQTWVHEFLSKRSFSSKKYRIEHTTHIANSHDKAPVCLHLKKWSLIFFPAGN